MNIVMFAYSDQPIVHKRMLYAGKLLCMTIVDFVESKDVQRELRMSLRGKPLAIRARPLFHR